MLLLLDSWTPALKVTAALAVIGAVDAKVVAALTVRVFAPLVPSTVLPKELRVLLLLIVTAALAVTAAAKVAAELTVRVLVPPAVPNMVLPKAVKAAFAVMGAVEAKVVTALTVSACEPEVPSTVLPLAVRVEVGLVRVTPAEKLARPALSMVRRSTG